MITCWRRSRRCKVRGEIGTSGPRSEEDLKRGLTDAEHCGHFIVSSLSSVPAQLTGGVVSDDGDSVSSSESPTVDLRQSLEAVNKATTDTKNKYAALEGHGVPMDFH